MASFNCFICAAEHPVTDVNSYKFKKTGNEYHVCDKCINKCHDFELEVKTIIASFNGSKDAL
jgi:hypothetical protein